jgi:hypothetical protein
LFAAERVGDALSLQLCFVLVDAAGNIDAMTS